LCCLLPFPDPKQPYQAQLAELAAKHGKVRIVPTKSSLHRWQQKARDPKQVAVKEVRGDPCRWWGHSTFQDKVGNAVHDVVEARDRGGDPVSPDEVQELVRAAAPLAASCRVNSASDGVYVILADPHAHHRC
jgi:hypothetical protein